MRRLLDLLRKQAPAPTEAYAVYTREYDRIVEAEKLDTVLGAPSAADRMATKDSWDLFYNSLQVWRTRVDLAALEMAERVRRVARDLPDTAIAILVDHSGSMKGQRILLAAAATDISYDFLVQLGCTVEVLGFTTVSWRGGRPREAWLRRGRRLVPGRLCELLHIVYRKAGDRVAASLAPMLRSGLLKENVDGEALLWAASRLRALPQRRKLLLIISDGAPVDDATLSANDLGYLDRHLIAVINEIEASEDVELAALGVGYDVGRYYAQAATVQTPEDLGLVMLNLLERQLTRAPISPTAAG
jgi:cobaltochelatase CobT